MAKYNRLGKTISDKGYLSLNDFIRRNEIDVTYNKLYKWCANKSTVYAQSLNAVSDIAAALEVNRGEVLNMISTDPVYDAFVSDADNPLKNKRLAAGLTPKECAELIGCDVQRLYDIENGKVKSFSDTETMRNYLGLFGMGLGEFQRAIKDIQNSRKKPIEAPYVPSDPEPTDCIIDEDLDAICPIMLGAELPESTPNNRLYEVKPNPAYESKPITLDTGVLDTVLEAIYGKVDYETFKKVRRVLSDNLGV